MPENKVAITIKADNKQQHVCSPELNVIRRACGKDWHSLSIRLSPSVVILPTTPSKADLTFCPYCNVVSVCRENSIRTRYPVVMTTYLTVFNRFVIGNVGICHGATLAFFSSMFHVNFVQTIWFCMMNSHRNLNGNFSKTHEKHSLRIH